MHAWRKQIKHSHGHAEDEQQAVAWLLLSGGERQQQVRWRRKQELARRRPAGERRRWPDGGLKEWNGGLQLMDLSLPLVVVWVGVGAFKSLRLPNE
ncbi:hypothetical protein BDA96_01G548900 [Sorghum bicolor]|jgi:hypothetical protein|uniref:Uncharacterized protein n=2 Tax=Sorghum bicolor TaxID=4558 RepID=A0A921V4B1_SORBI|nr:hypothetical protein BDA96_01G548900 [Sorghum bicolor]KXG40236.1 hypothetical protein SORBI_3001G513900 [Sorghum bicolor]